MEINLRNETVVPWSPEPPAPNPEALVAALNELAGRIAFLERRNVELSLRLCAAEGKLGIPLPSPFGTSAL